MDDGLWEAGGRLEEGLGGWSSFGMRPLGEVELVWKKVFGESRSQFWKAVLGKVGARLRNALKEIFGLTLAHYLVSASIKHLDTASLAALRTCLFQTN